MTWNYVAGDNYDLETLVGYRSFFIKDLLSAQREVDKHELLKKWGLPNWRLGMIRRQVGVEEAQKNFDKVIEVIKILERENK